MCGDCRFAGAVTTGYKIRSAGEAVSGGYKTDAADSVSGGYKTDATDSVSGGYKTDATDSVSGGYKTAAADSVSGGYKTATADSVSGGYKTEVADDEANPVSTGYKTDDAAMTASAKCMDACAGAAWMLFAVTARDGMALTVAGRGAFAVTGCFLLLPFGMRCAGYGYVVMNSFFACRDDFIFSQFVISFLPLKEPLRVRGDFSLLEVL